MGLALVSAALTLTCVAVTALAQDPASPEAVAKRAMAATDAGHYDELAKAMDPLALGEFRAMLVDLAQGIVEDEKADEIPKLFDGVRDLKALKALDGASVMAALMRGLEKQNPAIADARKERAKTEVRPVGRVADPKDTGIVYVVLRRISPEDREDTGTPEVLGLRKVGMDWKLLPRDDLKTWAAAMKKAHELRAKARKEGADPKAAAAALLKQFRKPGELRIEVYGIVPVGKDEADVVYVGSRKLGEMDSSRLNVTTISRGEEGWDLVETGDKAGLARQFKESPPLQSR
jgi:hypothetical protein